ncbi:MAG: hypothetical protein R3B89_16920 [Polyangiaceae bacterium]
MSSSVPSADLPKPPVDPSAGEEVAFVEPKHRGLRALFAATIVVSLLGVGAARDGAKRAEQLKCWGTLRNTARGDAWQCEQQAERWLGIASLLPWTRGGAAQTRTDLRIRAAELELFVATRGQPSRERRSVAASRLLSRSPELAPAASAALQSGAYPELIAFVSSRQSSLDPMSRDLSLSAALVEVNQTALAGLLAQAPGPSPLAEPTRAAALACLLLPPAAARPWVDGLQGADPSLREACFGLPHPQRERLETPADERLGDLALALFRLSPKESVERRAQHALRLVAPASVHPELTRLEPPRWYGPSDVLRGHHAVISLEALDGAANQLDVILGGDAEQIERALRREPDCDPGAAIFPVATLDRARFALRLHALSLALRRGDHRFAAQELELAAAHMPSGFELSLAAAHLAMREPRAALRLNQQHAMHFAESTSLEEAAQRSLQRAYAENELGDRGAALGAVLGAKRLCESAKRGAALVTDRDGDDSLESPPLPACAEVEWALAATAITARQFKILPEPIDLNKLVTGELEVETSGLPLWRTLAITPEVARRPLRVRLRRPALSTRWQAFGYQVAGEVLGDAGDIDVWLDASIGQHRAGDLLAYFNARASAARWRGDAEAERAWLARVERTTTLAVDDTASFLLARAGY